MTIKTKHGKIGYSNNVAIIEEGLRCAFGFNDDSHVGLALAAHIWSDVCGRYSSDDTITWGSKEIEHALANIDARIAKMKTDYAALMERVAAREAAASN